MLISFNEAYSRLSIEGTRLPFCTSLQLPGDKSISHRVAILAALAKGTSTIRGFLESEDCLATLSILKELGIVMEHPEPGLLRIYGQGGRLKAPSAPLYCGNSGTALRLLSGVLAAQPFSSQLYGDSSLCERPMKRIIEPLEGMGAVIQATGEKHAPPLLITGKKLRPLSYRLPLPSAQVKSALLLAALFTPGETVVIEPILCRDHTERLFSAFQMEHSITQDPQGIREIRVVGPQRPIATSFHVPGDISSAAFWLVAAAARPGSYLEIQKSGLNPTRTGILTVLKRMGATIEQELLSEEKSEPYGTITVRGACLRATSIEGAEIANVIDELPILAVAGALAQGVTIIRNAKELRVKETDRISALVTNLQAMGVAVIEKEDGMEIHGGRPLQGATLSSYGDHRIAMAFAIAALFAEGKTVIEGTECIATSYPDFFSHLKKFILSS